MSSCFQSEPEQHQHKSSIQRKQHGMTPLGKVPTARRPTNLPSEKSEHSGNDPSINLVPSGGAGWGNKPNETVATTTPSLVSEAIISVDWNHSFVEKSSRCHQNQYCIKSYIFWELVLINLVIVTYR